MHGGVDCQRGAIPTDGQLGFAQLGGKFTNLVANIGIGHLIDGIDLQIRKLLPEDLQFIGSLGVQFRFIVLSQSRQYLAELRAGAVAVRIGLDRLSQQAGSRG